MATLAELTVQLMTARLAKRDLSFEELQREMDYFATKLKSIESGCCVTQVPIVQEILLPQEPVAPIAPVVLAPEPPVPYKPKKPVYEQIDLTNVFRDDKVVCLECSKEFGSLNRHLTLTHNMTPAEYKQKYNIPAKQKLCSKNLSENAKKSAIDRGQGNVMARSRAAKKAATVEATEATTERS
jgi:predicted transcriptional regulator